MLIERMTQRHGECLCSHCEGTEPAKGNLHKEAQAVIRAQREESSAKLERYRAEEEEQQEEERRQADQREQKDATEARAGATTAREKAKEARCSQREAKQAEKQDEQERKKATAAADAKEVQARRATAVAAKEQDANEKQRLKQLAEERKAELRRLREVQKEKERAQKESEKIAQQEAKRAAKAEEEAAREQARAKKQEARAEQSARAQEERAAKAAEREGARLASRAIKTACGEDEKQRRAAQILPEQAAKHKAAEEERARLAERRRQQGSAPMHAGSGPDWSMVVPLALPLAPGIPFVVAQALPFAPAASPMHPLSTPLTSPPPIRDGQMHPPAAAEADAELLRARYATESNKFASLAADNYEAKMKRFCSSLSAVYGELPFARLDWGTSILGTLIGLVCAQTCKNSWSSIGYANLAASFPSASGEPDWDLIRRRRVEDIVPCIWHGPYFHRKAERIHAILERAYSDSGGRSTSLEHLKGWSSARIRAYLMDFNGLSGKSIACLLLYRMGRVDFAVDANVLRVMTRLGWLKSIGIHAQEAISVSDRRAALRQGATLPPMPHPAMREMATRPHHQRPRGAAAARVCCKLSVGSDGLVSFTTTVLGRRPKQVHMRVRLQLVVNASGQVGVDLAVASAPIPTSPGARRVPESPAKRQRLAAPVAQPIVKLQLALTEGGCVAASLQIAPPPIAPLPLAQLPTVAAHVGAYSMGLAHSGAARRRRCGVCDGCCSTNCGLCSNCLDMPWFGGEGRKKQTCIQRRCRSLGAMPMGGEVRLPTPPVLATTNGGGAAAGPAVFPTPPMALASFLPTAPCVPLASGWAAADVLGVGEAEVASFNDALMDMAVEHEAGVMAEEDVDGEAEGADRAEGEEAATGRADFIMSDELEALAEAAGEAFESSEGIDAMLDDDGLAEMAVDDATDRPMLGTASADGIFSRPTEQEALMSNAIRSSMASVPALGGGDGDWMMLDAGPSAGASAAVNEATTPTGVARPSAFADGGASTPLKRPAGVSVPLDSDAYRSAAADTPIRVAGSNSRRHCKKHNRYHICKWTRHQARLEAGGAAVAGDEAVGIDGAATIGGALEAEDIEELPKALKRYSRRVQERMQSILPTETAAGSELATLMYRAHVFMITHGAVMCGETPQCGDCPMRSECEYGSLLYSEGRRKVHFAGSVVSTPPTQAPPVSEAMEEVCSTSEGSPPSPISPAQTALPHSPPSPLSPLSPPSPPSPSSRSSPHLVHSPPSPPSPPSPAEAEPPTPRVQPSFEMATAAACGFESASVTQAHSSPLTSVDSLMSQMLNDDMREAPSPTAVESTGHVGASNDVAAADAQSMEVESVLSVSEPPAAASMAAGPGEASSLGMSGAAPPPGAVQPGGESIGLLTCPDTSGIVTSVADVPALTTGSLHAVDTAVAEDGPSSPVSQMSYARVVRDTSLAPSHPGDETPRLLLIDGSVGGDYVKGRLLFSPWTAFKGVFPMHGTYFAQNEVFEDESAGEVRMPLSALGEERRVYLGKSIEGVLRRRTAEELARLFRESYVCIRRFRSADGRLLPLLLDPPRLLKNHATPSALALQLGLTAPVTPATEAGATSEMQTTATGALGLPVDAAGEMVGLPTGQHQGATAIDGAAPPDDTHDEAASDDDDQAEYRTQLARGLRLFKLYVAAGGALCMRHTIWRKLVPVLHPDKGGHTAVFQLLNDLKRRVDLNEQVQMPQVGDALEDAESDAVYERLRDEMVSAASVAGDAAVRQVESL